MSERIRPYLYATLCATTLVLLCIPILAYAAEAADGSLLSQIGGTVYRWTIQWALQLIFTFLGFLLISLSSMLAVIAGAVFDALIQWTVVDLSLVLQKLGIADGINLVWEAFRDIANILIIGMFVFIAISIILGITRYGDKAMIARVLIVAVLINFSLLFTRIIIDSSNLVAGIFYKESIAAVAGTAGQGAPTTSEQGIVAAAQSTSGIAGAFMGRAGVPGLFDTAGVLYRIGTKNDSAAIIIVYAVAVSTFLLVSALIFLYASFLMVSRAILLIFVTITSSLAFASYLIPQFGDSQYGWKGWWEMLIKAALFGPLLMIFLWASLVLLRAPQGSANLIEFIQNPGNQNGWLAIIMFLFVIGFLYVSVKLASMFAKNIGGFSMAALAPALALGLGGRIAAFAGRRTLGLAASGAGAWAQMRGTDIRRAGLDKDGKPLSPKAMGGWRPYATNRLQQAMYDTSEKAAKKIATRDFNATHSMLGREIQKVAQFKKSGTFTGEDTKGYAGAEKRATERYAREGERVAMSKEEQEKFIDKVREDVFAGNTQLAGQNKDAMDRLIASQNELAQAMNASIEHTNSAAKSQKILRESEQHLEDLISGGVRDTSVARQEVDRRREEHDRDNSNLEQVKSRISQAQKSIKRDTDLQRAILDRVDEIAKDKGLLPEKFLDAQEAAFESARGRFTNVLREKMGIPLTEKNDSLAYQSRAAVTTRKEKKDLGRISDMVRGHMDSSKPSAPRSPGGP